jgi:hypothetical protein
LQSAAHSDFYDGNIYFSLENNQMQDQRSFRKADFIRFKKAFIGLINSQTNSSEISIPLILIRSRNLLSEGGVVN